MKYSFAAIAAMVLLMSFVTGDVKYGIDAQKTSATWIGRKLTGQHTGAVNISNGWLSSDGKIVTSGHFDFDMTKLTCTDITNPADNAKMIEHLNGIDFFDVTKFQTAAFDITKVVLKKENDYDVTGKLTLRGITNEITFQAMIKFDNKAIVAIAKILVDRTKFDIKFHSPSVFANIGDKAIYDEFELNVNLVATVLK